MSKYGYHRSSIKSQDKKENAGSFFKYLMFFVVIAEPISAIPQIYEVWVDKNIAGISMLTWSLWSVAAGIWVVYSLKIRDKMLLISSSLWVTVQSLVVIGVAIH